MESIKDKVAIIGMGCTQFGELWDKSVDDLVIDAVYEAMQDAGIESKQIQAAWVGTTGNYAGETLSKPLKLPLIPVTRVENACASGEDCLRNAAFGLISKAYDIVLAVGCEKQKDYGAGQPEEPRRIPYQFPVREVISAPSAYAMAANRYFHQYGLSYEEGKRMLAKISVRSHHNGARNPRAHLRREITVDQVLNAPMIASPLGLYDCCGVTDGAVAAILCRTEDAKKFRNDYAVIKGLGFSIGNGQDELKTDYDYTFAKESYEASRQAYEMAGIKNPRKELDIAEVHDCFSIAEVIAYESLGFCERGKSKYDIENNSFTQEGDLPVNMSGGLKSFGHPIGASGVRAVYELYTQIQGKAQDPSRQIKNVRLGLAHSQGGTPGQGFITGVVIVGAP